jgi:hypothetical protein
VRVVSVRDYINELIDTGMTFQDAQRFLFERLQEETVTLDNAYNVVER